MAALALRVSAACHPSAELEAEFENAGQLAGAVANPFGALERAAPFRAVRDRHPDDIFAQERYQDAVNEYGIEGHLRLLNKEYLELEFRHPGEPMYHYLYLRTLAGRQTPSAIAGLSDLVAAHRDFAAAHRTLAEVYSTELFRDQAQEKMERERYLHLCPGGKFTRWPPAIPEPSRLIAQAEASLRAGADPKQVIAMTIQGLKELEWRSQRIRAFDWFSLEAKRQDARDVRDAYRQARDIQMRCYREMGVESN